MTFLLSPIARLIAQSVFALVSACVVGQVLAPDVAELFARIRPPAARTARQVRRRMDDVGLSLWPL